MVDSTADKPLNCPSMWDPTTRKEHSSWEACLTRSKLLTLSNSSTVMARSLSQASSWKNSMARERDLPSSFLTQRKSPRQPKINFTRKKSALMADMLNFMTRMTSSWRRSAICSQRKISDDQMVQIVVVGSILYYSMTLFKPILSQWICGESL